MNDAAITRRGRNTTRSVEGALHAWGACGGDRERRPVLGGWGRLRIPYRRHGNPGHLRPNPDPPRPSFVRRFHGAGSAAGPSPASSPSPTPGGRSRPALLPAPTGRADTSRFRPMGGGSRPAGPPAPPGNI